MLVHYTQLGFPGPGGSSRGAGSGPGWTVNHLWSNQLADLALGTKFYQPVNIQSGYRDGGPFNTAPVVAAFYGLRRSHWAECTESESEAL
jgi:hypothetical protein